MPVLIHFPLPKEGTSKASGWADVETNDRTFRSGSPFVVTALKGVRGVKAGNAADTTLYANFAGAPDHAKRGEAALGGRRGGIWTIEAGYEGLARLTLAKADHRVS